MRLFLPIVKSLRLAWRLIFFLCYTTYIVTEIRLKKALLNIDLRSAMRVRRRWARTLLHGVGVRIAETGTPPDFPCIIVSNHRSYLDPILLLRRIDGFPVAKAELSKWPVIGKGAQLAGILYLQREQQGSRMQTLRQMEEKIKDGFPVIIYPEGTTSGLAGTLPFKKGVFQVAARTGTPVVPVALCFADARDFWVGDEGFLSHAGRRFREKELHVELRYGPALQSAEAEKLMEDARNWIEAQLLQP